MPSPRRTSASLGMQISPLAGHLVRALAKLVAHACAHALVRMCTELGQWLLVVPVAAPQATSSFNYQACSPKSTSKDNGLSDDCQARPVILGIGS